MDDDQRIEYEGILATNNKFLTGLIDSMKYPPKFLKKDLCQSFIRSLYLITGQLLAYITIYSEAHLPNICLFDEFIKHSGSIAVLKLIQYLIWNGAVSTPRTTIDDYVIFASSSAMAISY